MISFIIIGRNEGWKLTKCLQSVYETIEKNSLINAEVIYVDSKSTDDSILIAKRFPETKVFQITKDYNAAIARNIGAKEAMGDVLFFIDGDMELLPSGFKEIYNVPNLNNGFISGDFNNKYIDDKGNLIREARYFNNKLILKSYTTGGLFIIKKELWQSFNGMRNIFKRSQDMDFGLRLAKKGFLNYRFPIILANHYTIDYYGNRLWSLLFNKTHLYGRSLLYRKNVLNLYALKLILKQDYSLLFLILNFGLSIIFTNIYFMLVYFVLIIIRSLMKKHLQYIAYFIIRDIQVLLGMLFFFPRKPKIEYIQIL